MRIRFLILSLLFVAYGTMVSHEVVFGHHLSPDKVCHHHDNTKSHSHEQGCNHLPCLMIVNPHLLSSNLEFNLYISDSEQASKDNFYFEDLMNSAFSRDVRIFSTNRVKVKLAQSPVFRSQSLRGPPSF